MVVFFFLSDFEYVYSVNTLIISTLIFVSQVKFGQEFITMNRNIKKTQ